MTAPSPGALRMRRSRERRRLGDVIVNLEVGPNITADLADLGWLPEPDRVDKDALAGALIELIERAIAMRVRPGSEGICDNTVARNCGADRDWIRRRGPKCLRNDAVPRSCSDLGASNPARFSQRPTA
jgi:hypothetical protein